MLKNKLFFILNTMHKVKA